MAILDLYRRWVKETGAIETHIKLFDDMYTLRLYRKNISSTYTEHFSENMFTAMPNNVFEEQVLKLVVDKS